MAQARFSKAALERSKSQRVPPKARGLKTSLQLAEEPCLRLLGLDATPDKARELHGIKVADTFQC
jgi:hypothetical protein